MSNERLVWMLFRCGVMFWTMAFIAEGQTLVDLRTKSKSVDFSAASTTKPMSTGAALPVACGVGQAFFLTNAPAGSNFYLCTSQNSWTLQAGTAGPGGPPGPAGASGPSGANGAIAHVQKQRHQPAGGGQPEFHRRRLHGRSHE